MVASPASPGWAVVRMTMESFVTSPYSGPTTLRSASSQHWALRALRAQTLPWVGVGDFFYRKERPVRSADMIGNQTMIRNHLGSHSVNHHISPAHHVIDWSSSRILTFQDLRWTSQSCQFNILNISNISGSGDQWAQLRPILRTNKSDERSSRAEIFIFMISITIGTKYKPLLPLPLPP